MLERISRKFAFFPIAFLVFLLMTFAQGAIALSLEPSHISGPEGSVIALNILIDAEDLVEPDNNALNQCAAAGISAQLVARYFLRRVNGSATFSNTATNGDLHLASAGVPKSDLYALWCVPGWYPEDQLDTQRSIVFHEDGESEGTETATLELWKVDLSNKKTFVSETTIAISDSRGSNNSNSCSSTPLSSGAPGPAGTISTSDCDDSPRGSDYLADSFTFSGTQGEEVLIEADWVNFDGYLYLEAPDGSLEDQNDKHIDTSVSRIERVLKQSGTYMLWATTNNKGDTGDYQISLTRTQDPENLTDWLLSTLAVTPTSLLQNDTLSISVLGQSNASPSFFSGGGVDVVYLLSTDSLISESDTELGSESYCCATGFNGEWQGTLNVAAGTYWVGACITSSDADSANNCTNGTQLTVSASLATSCNSRVLNCDTPLAGSLNEESCTGGPQGPGYFAEKFTLLGESGVTLWLDASWDFDGYLFLKDPRGKVIAESDNHTGPADAHIEYTPRENGTYSVWASSYQPQVMGGYELSLDCVAPAGPDLVLDTPTVQSTTLVPGQSFELNVDMRNSGDQPADSSALHFVLSSDYLIDLNDPEIGAGGAVGLLAGEAASIDKMLAAPVTPGKYWIGVCADVVANESAVSNNCSTGRGIEVKPQSECTENVISCGQFIGSVINTKDCASSPRGTGFLAEVLEVDVDLGDVLVADASWFGVDGYLLLEDPSGNLVAENDDAGDAQHSRIEYQAQDSGIHRFWTTSLQRGAIGSYEFDLKCSSAPGPDLVASQVTLADSEAVVTDIISVSAVVYNDGSFSSDASNVHFMLSSDEAISTDDLVIGSQPLDAIPPVSSLGIEATVALPEQAGNYWLGICVEAVAGEILTWNNCTHENDPETLSSIQSGHASGKLRPRTSVNAGTLIEVSTGAACISSSMSCGQNRSGTLGQNDCDLGPRGTGYFSDIYSFYGSTGDSVSLNVDWSGIDGYLYLVDPTGKLVGQNDDFLDTDHSRLEYVLPKSGNYLVWPSAHKQGDSGTYNLSLNCNAPFAPDLLVDTPQLDASTIRPGQSLSLAAEVSNQGNEDSVNSSMRFFLTGSSTLSPGDRELGKTDVPILVPGESSLESMTVALDAPPGTYWLAACVDADVLELNSSNNCAVSGPLTVEDTNHPIAISAAMNDAWYNPATNGQGFFINVFPDGQAMYLSWFTFDVERPDADVPVELGDAGHRWLTALGTYERGVAELDIYLNQGGVFDQASPVPTESLYGSMTVSFSDCNHGEIEFDIPSAGEYGTIPITRVATDNLSACEVKIGALASKPEATGGQADGTANTAFKINPGLNDAWYNPDTPGQGFSFNVFPRLGSAFVSWFTYDTERPPENVTGIIDGPGLRWLTAPGGFKDDTAELTLYEVGGGVFNSAEPAPDEIEYGTITVHFDDCNSGQLHYDIPSLARQGEVPIQRIAGDTVPVCEQEQIPADQIALEISPANKSVMENFCGGTASWLFDWPDMLQASGYLVELWRNDALIPMTFTVNGSEFRYEKESAIASEHLTGWQWRYRPQYTAVGKTSEFSQVFTFDVGACE